MSVFFRAPLECTVQREARGGLARTAERAGGHYERRLKTPKS